MKNTAITKRLSGLGGAKWEVYLKAKDLIAQGRDIIEMTIGEPDVPTPEVLVDAATCAMRQGRTTYASGRGEPGLLAALAERYTRSSGRDITSDQILCFPVRKRRCLPFSWVWQRLVMRFLSGIRCTRPMKA